MEILFTHALKDTMQNEDDDDDDEAYLDSRSYLHRPHETMEEFASLDTR